MNMDIVDKLNYLMNKKHIKNLLVLSKDANIPYTTLASIFKRTSPDIRLSTSKKLCDFFNITLDELLDDNIPLPDFRIDDPKNDSVDVSGLDDRTKTVIKKIINEFRNAN